tara:strand:- start:28 stop:1317 length:1290 start_codon:yes stop_codon:yes gene_type:complete
MKIKSGKLTRKITILILNEVLENGLPFDEAFIKSIKEKSPYKISDKDKAFIYLLSSSVLRYLTQIDSTIASLLKDPIKKLAINPKMALRIGLAQIFVLGTPIHAAVDTSVDAASKKWRGLVNAIMRNISREESKYKKIFNSSPKIPKWLMERWRENWPKDYTNFIKSIQNIHPHIDVAVKKDIKHWQIKLNAQILPDNVLRINDPGLISQKVGYNDGEWWVQDYSSQIPIKVFSVKKDEEILDLCAAPGGKTAQMLTLGARVLSIDKNKNRIKKFNENMKRLKFDANIIEVDILDYSTKKKWNKILLDAPCSSTGTIRKNPDILYSHSTKSINNLSKLQKNLMKKSWSMLNKNGLLMYCNCSLEPEEGEKIIEEFLSNNKNAKIIKFKPEEYKYLNNSIKRQGWIRVLPSDKGKVKNTDGFFIAQLQKI